MEKVILNLRKMAGFRRMVNRNFIDNTEMPYEDSQDTWQSGEETNQRSPSLLSNNPPRTSTPKAYNFAPFQFNLMSMYQPLQGQRTHFQPSFFDTNYATQNRPSTGTSSAGNGSGEGSQSQQTCASTQNDIMKREETNGPKRKLMPW